MKCQFTVTATNICFDKYEQACLVCPLVIFKHKRVDCVFAASIFRNLTLTCMRLLTRTTSYNLESRIECLLTILGVACSCNTEVGVSERSKPMSYFIHHQNK